MTDDVKDALDELGRRALPAASSARAVMLLDWVRGEPARTAEAVERAREEQREACARAGVAAVRHSQQTTDQCRLEVGSAIRATPITATPLADELERSWNEKAALVDEEMIAVRKLLMRFAP
jgi:hypothetical protein